MSQLIQIDSSTFYDPQNGEEYFGFTSPNHSYPNDQERHEFISKEINSVIESLVEDNLRESSAIPVLSVPQYIGRLTRYKPTYTEAGSFKKLCDDVAREATAKYLVKWFANSWFDDISKIQSYYQDKIDKGVAEIVEFRTLQRIRPLVDQKALTAYLGKILSDDIARWARISSATVIENLEAELTLCLSETEQREFLTGEYKTRLSTYKEDAAQSPIAQYNFEFLPWQCFTSRHLADTCKNYVDAGSFIASEGLELDIMILDKRPQHENVKTQARQLATKWLIIEWIKNKITPSAPTDQQTDKQAAKPVSQPIAASFQDLFRNQAEIESCIDKLRLIGEPVIDERRNWIKGGGHKYVLVAWIDVLETRGKIECIDRPTLCSLLSDFFPGFKISDSTFRKATKAASAYHAVFLQLIK